jgi:hypothetical protein
MGFCFFSLSLVMGGDNKGRAWSVFLIFFKKIDHWLGEKKVEIHVGKSHVSQTLKFHHKVLRNP